MKTVFSPQQVMRRPTGTCAVTLSDVSVRELELGAFVGVMGPSRLEKTWLLYLLDLLGETHDAAFVTAADQGTEIASGRIRAVTLGR